MKYNFSVIQKGNSLAIYTEEYTEAKTDTTKDDFLKVYYISAGQTSFFQVQWKILHRYVFLCSRYLRNTGNTQK